MTHSTKSGRLGSEKRELTNPQKNMINKKPVPPSAPQPQTPPAPAA